MFALHICGLADLSIRRYCQILRHPRVWLTKPCKISRPQAMRVFSSTEFFFLTSSNVNSVVLKQSSSSASSHFLKNKLIFCSCYIGGMTVGSHVFRETGKIEIFFCSFVVQISQARKRKDKNEDNVKIKYFLDCETKTRKFSISYDFLQLLSSLTVWSDNYCTLWRFWYENVTLHSFQYENHLRTYALRMLCC